MLKSYSVTLGRGSYVVVCSDEDGTRRQIMDGFADEQAAQDWADLQPTVVDDPVKPTIEESAFILAALLDVIVRMSDDVKSAASPLDQQGKLLRMQNSIQRNAARLTPYIEVVLKARFPM